MARYNDAISVTFNDNDGSVGWKCHPSSMQDLTRHWRIFGVWRTRWILFKQFWTALRWLESYSDNTGKLRKQSRKWVTNSEVPE